VLADGSEQVATGVRAFDDYQAVGAQDMVILAMKAHQVEAVVDEVPKLLGPETVVVTMQNGIPTGTSTSTAASWRQLREERGSARPDPAQAGPERVIGCVVYPASELIAPAWSG